MTYAVSDSSTLDKAILLDLDATSTAADGQEGTIVQSTDGRRYKKVVVDASAVANGAGYPAYYMVGTTANEVTSDYSDCSASAELVGAGFAGVFCAAVTAGTATYQWIETPAGAVTADASLSTEVGVCDALMAADDAYFQIADSDSRVVAIAMEAAASNIGDIVMIGS